MTNKTNMLSKDNFAKNLRRLRIEKGYTIEEFANELDKSTRLIYDYENGIKYPSLATLIEIVNVLSTTIDSILRTA